MQEDYISVPAPSSPSQSGARCCSGHVLVCSSLLLRPVLFVLLFFSCWGASAGSSCFCATLVLQDSGFRIQFSG